MRIFFFGDSITQGFFDSHGGWAQRIAREFHQQTLASITNPEDQGYKCFNLGISGDTTEGVRERITSEVESRQISEDKNCIILAIGTNDSILRNNRALMDVYEFQELYEQVLDNATKLSDKVLCVGLTAVDENLSSPVAQSSTGKQYRNQRLNVFEDTIKQSCFSRNIPFVPIHDMFLAALNNGEELLSDGLHPNDAGHTLIANTVLPEIRKVLNT